MSTFSAIGYPISIVQRAREHREAGWSYERIADHVETETGVRPNKSTVFRWCNESAARRDRESSLRRWHRQRSAVALGRLGCDRHTPEFQEARARAMVESGMRMTQVALAMAFDYPGEGWDYLRVRRLADKRARAAA